MAKNKLEICALAEYGLLIKLAAVIFYMYNKWILFPALCYDKYIKKMY